MSYTVGDYTDTRIGLLPPDLQDLITEMALEPIIFIQRVVRGTISRVRLMPPAYRVTNELAWLR